MKKELASRDWTLGLLILYIALVIWFVLFQMQFSFDALERTREIRLVPFFEVITVSKGSNFFEIINTIFIFVPFGVYMVILFPHWNFKQKLWPIVLFGLFLEICPYLFSIGILDITTFLSHILGGAIGIFLAASMYRFMKTAEVFRIILNFLATIGTILFLALFLTLWIVQG